MTADETALRQRLHELTSACDWPEWDVVRFVLADLLEEEGRHPEADMTRAPWKCVDCRRRPWHDHGKDTALDRVWQFRMAIPKVPHVYPLAAKLKGRIVASTVLGFLPRTLLAKRFSSGLSGTWELLLTWCPERGSHHWNRADTMLHPLGLAGLWAPEKRERGLFD